MNTRDRTLVIVPAFNEEQALARVLDDLETHRPAVDVLVVDDGSHDQTSRIALARKVHVVRHPMNLGYGVSVKTGYLFAVQHGYAVALLFDADGQHLAQEIETIANPVFAGRADLVIGSRYQGRGVGAGGRTDYRGSLARRMGTVLFSRLVSASIGSTVTDVTSGFRAASRRALTFFAAHYPTDFPEIETILLARKAGLRVLEVPVAMRPRAGGRSFHTLGSSLLWPLKTVISMLVTSLRQEGQEAWEASGK